MQATVNGPDGYTVQINGAKVTVSRGEKSKVYELPESSLQIHDKVPGATADSLRKIGSNPSDFFSMSGWPIRHCARQAIDAAVAELEAMRQAEDDREEATLLAAVPGLDALRDAIDDNARYRRELSRMMEDENNDGARPPRGPKNDVSALAKQFPRAALYLKAENYSFASHWAKAKAGDQAMQLLASGGDESEANRILENWLSDNGIEVD